MNENKLTIYKYIIKEGMNFVDIYKEYEKKDDNDLLHENKFIFDNFYAFLKDLANSDTHEIDDVEDAKQKIDSLNEMILNLYDRVYIGTKFNENIEDYLNSNGANIFELLHDWSNFYVDINSFIKSYLENKRYKAKEDSVSRRKSSKQYM